MKARFTRSWALASRANLALALGLMLAQSATSSARADIATPEQKKAARPTSIVSAPAKSPTSGPSPPACGGKRPISAKPAGRCSSSEGTDPAVERMLAFLKGNEG
jgi:hypothetical protein